MDQLLQEVQCEETLTAAELAELEYQEYLYDTDPEGQYQAALAHSS